MEHLILVEGVFKRPKLKFFGFSICPQGPRLAAPHLTLTHGIFLGRIPFTAAAAVAIKQSTAYNRCQSCIWRVFNWLFKTGIIVLSLKILEHVESMNKNMWFEIDRRSPLAHLHSSPVFIECSDMERCVAKGVLQIWSLKWQVFHSSRETWGNVSHLYFIGGAKGPTFSNNKW